MIRRISRIRYRKKPTIKSRIRRDLDYAVEKGITKFELLGYEDVPELLKHFRYVAREWWEEKAELMLEEERVLLRWETPIPVYIPTSAEPHYVRATENEDENGVVHVVAEIDDEALEWIIERSIDEEQKSRVWRKAEGIIE